MHPALTAVCTVVEVLAALAAELLMSGCVLPERITPAGSCIEIHDSAPAGLGASSQGCGHRHGV